MSNEYTIGVSQQTNDDVDIAEQSVGNLAVEQQSPVGIEDSAGTQIDPLAVSSQPLDVSGAEVNVDLNSQSGAPFDVSAAEVDVDLNSLTYGTLPVEQQTPVGIEDTGGAQVDPSIKGNQLRELENVGTAKRIHARVTADTTIYTVPTGATFYLVSAVCFNTGANGGAIKLFDNAGNSIGKLARHEATAFVTRPTTITPPYTLPESYYIQLARSAGTEDGTVFGYEV